MKAEAGHFCGEPLEGAQFQGVSLVKGAQGITRMGKMMLGMLMKSTDLIPTYTYPLGGRGLNKGTMASANTSIPRESCPKPALTLKLVSLVSPVCP